MTPIERQELEVRYWQLECQIQNIHAGKVVDGDLVEVEAGLLEQQDAIEFELGRDYFESR
jgi:hypothetical protein